MKRCLGSSGFIQVNGEMLPYRVERRNVRYPRLEFKTAELLVILPGEWSDETTLLEEKMGWISKRHARVRKATEELRSDTGSNRLPLLGDFFEFRESEALKVDFDGKIIEFNPGNSNHLGRLELVLKRKLLQELEPAVDEYSKKLGVKFNRITIKKQRTRWGSCSSRGNLNFNLWLVCLPRELIRYVAWHEVAHAKEKNHGQSFWKLVSSEFGNYREMEKKLSEYWLLVQNATLLTGSRS